MPRPASSLPRNQTLPWTPTFPQNRSSACLPGGSRRWLERLSNDNLIQVTALLPVFLSPATYSPLAPLVFACHLRVNRTTFLLKRHLWWSTMENDTKQFVAACTVCARGKAFHCPPAGLLHPLPVHGRPWTHVASDFITGVPVSKGNTAILTIVNRFLKATHFVALTILPSAFKTAELLINHVMEYPPTSRTAVHSSSSKFAMHSGPLSVCPQVSTPRPTARQRGPTRTWRPPYAVWQLQTPTAGALIWPGVSILIIHEPFLPWVYPRLKPPWAISLLFLEQEVELAIPSVQHHILKCREIRRKTQAVLLQTKERN